MFKNFFGAILTGAGLTFGFYGAQYTVNKLSKHKVADRLEESLHDQIEKMRNKEETS